MEIVLIFELVKIPNGGLILFCQTLFTSMVPPKQMDD